MCYALLQAKMLVSASSLHSVDVLRAAASHGDIRTASVRRVCYEMLWQLLWHLLRRCSCLHRACSCLHRACALPMYYALLAHTAASGRPACAGCAMRCCGSCCGSCCGANGAPRCNGVALVLMQADRVSTARTPT